MRLESRNNKALHKEIIPADFAGIFLYSIQYKTRGEIMLLKSKICFTVLSVYEIIAVSAMHFKRVCDSMFPTEFCDSWFRYFLFCIVVPLLIFLILMWVREIVRYHRRRSFIRRARNTVNGILGNIRNKISKHVDVQDMEKIITAAILVGIKKYVEHHPNLRENINHVVDVANGDVEIDVMAVPEKRKTAKKQTSNLKGTK